ncbi:MAG: hypothetical protein JSS79_18720 [Bacteroidetes bacterium]|nr:hypothetical protein [Bacteroidota bacterium]
MKSIVTLIALCVATAAITLVGFYYFTTRDDNYEWSKDFSEIIRAGMVKNSFAIGPVKEINTSDVKLPIERIIQLKLQKIGSKIGLTRYENEFGQSITVTSSHNRKVTFKAWCLGDHIKGLEVEYENLSSMQVDSLKTTIHSRFDGYNIIWTNKKPQF